MKTTLLWTMLFISSISFSQVYVNRNVTYVNKNATGDNNGTSWTNAYKNLHTALGAVGQNESIWVAKGTYKPDVSDRDKFFQIGVTGLKLYGGFAGTETRLSDRDMSKIHTDNATIISGDLLGNDDTNITFNNTTRNDNSKILIVISGDNNQINGFVITGANNTNKAGAIYKYAGNINTTIEYCKIVKNISVKGGAITLQHDMSSRANKNSTLKINANIFENNLATYGTAFFADPKTGNLNFNFTNNLVVNNSTKKYDNTFVGYGGTGGYISNTRATVKAKIINNTFANNKNEGSSNSDFATLAFIRSSRQRTNLEAANNIFWGNTKNNNVRALAIGKLNASIPTFPTNVYNSIDEDNFSNISNKLNVTNNNPNLTVDFKLQANSTVAINKGDNNKVPTGITKDLAGNNRIKNNKVDIGAYEFDTTTASIRDIAFTNNVIIYPNPVSTRLHLKTSDFNTIKKITIYNLLGKKVIETKATIIDIGKLPKGMYILKVLSNHNHVAVKKFIKR